jgi:hypothetical protein
LRTTATQPPSTSGLSFFFAPAALPAGILPKQASASA